jgi:hypothetical protein
MGAYALDWSVFATRVADVLHGRHPWLMRSVHFRVSDAMYIPIQQGSEDVGASVAQFCREAATARAVLWEARRGFNWNDPEIRGQIMEQIERVEAHDAKLRATFADAGDSTPTQRPNHRDLGRALSEACDPLPEDRSGPSRQKH